MLRGFINHPQDNWEKLLPAVEFAYNSSVQASTGQTPFFLDMGRQPLSPLDAMDIHQTAEAEVPAVTHFLFQQKKALQEAMIRLQKAQEVQKEQADNFRRDLTFKVGDKVLLSSRNMTIKVGSRKLLPKFLGPFQVLECIHDTAFKLQLPPSMKIHPVFHISLLKPYKENNSFLGRHQTPPQPIVVDNEEEWEVEEVLDQRTKRNQVQYLVKWKGYPFQDATWESAQNLAHAPQKIAEFQGKLASSSKLKGKKPLKR